MIDKKELEALVEEGLSGSDCFVVDVQVKPDNVLVVEIDNKEGVDIERCETLHRFLESKLDRDVEDYELEVGSAGITSPFKVLKQYEKNIGNEVELLTKKGEKLSGILKSASLISIYFFTACSVRIVFRAYNPMIETAAKSILSKTNTVSHVTAALTASAAILAYIIYFCPIQTFRYVHARTELRTSKIQNGRRTAR